MTLLTYFFCQGNSIAFLFRISQFYLYHFQAKYLILLYSTSLKTSTILHAIFFANSKIFIPNELATLFILVSKKNSFPRLLQVFYLLDLFIKIF